MATVFISSTGKDLEEYRAKAIEVCNRLGLTPIAMEFFEATGKGATAGSKAKLDKADLYVGIFAHRYGYIEEGFSQSVTEIEFDYAGERKLDRLCFVVDPKHPWPPEHTDHENYGRLKEFKNRIGKLIRNKFTTVDNFDSQLMQSLSHGTQPTSKQKIFHIPHQRNPNFTGRGELLEKVRETLTGGESAAVTQAAIHGLGGVGKSQLAIEYVYRYAPDYSLVWWLRSEKVESLNADYEALAIKLGLVSGEERSEQAQVVEMVREALERRSGWLLVFDNVPKPKDIKEYLPKGSAGHVLITSRHGAWGRVARSVSVKVWEPAESVRFLLKRTGHGDEAAAGELAAELGHLPLALEQAAAYMEEAGRSLAGYLELFREHKLRLFEADDDAPEDEATVTTTWDISFQQVREDSSAAAELLHLCAFLGPDDIPVDMIADGAEHLPESLGSAVSDGLDLDKAIKALRSYSLVEVGGESRQERSLSMHRLVQAVTREQLPEEDRKRWAEAAVRVVNEAFPGDSDDVRTWPVCGRLAPHAAQAAEHAERLQVGLDAAGRLLNQLGTYAHGRAELGQAKGYFERAIAIYEEIHGSEHPNVATLVNNIGTILKAQGDLVGALEYSRRALAIGEKVYGPEHPKVAIRANNIGQILKAQGDLAGALEYTRRALAIDEKVYGLEHPDVARDANNIGQILKAQGDLAGALEYARRALAIEEKGYGPENPKVAICASNIGQILQAQGDLAGALEYTRRALAIDEKVYGLEHPDVAIDANNIGTILKAEGDPASALEYVQRALDILESVYGKDNPTTRIAAANLEALKAAMK